ncbi:diphosphomevalonate decarboxylase [Bacillus tuaregi]|uniref:diphosphomevalonate decarboxylase n=1 Tax=Bacillus tuaregi TaxID=1816695 RepID=UPI0008F8AABE|nr:diphosphomevalonate decarboxylase [Bacillus tuaregi]
MQATARANTNIALIKYWGKRDEDLFLPMNSSISITLDQFYTTTTVQFCESISADLFVFNQQLANEAETLKVTRFLDIVRKMAGKEWFALVHSTNKVPTAAGLASSASGFAALAAASAKAIGLDLEEKELSKLARQGSGSASRSIFGGFVEWQKGTRTDGDDSYAKPILREQDWKLSILSVIVASREKKVSSREGMRRTVETSAFYSGWLETVERDMEIARAAINERDFERLGEVVEANALKMHATTLGAKPPFTYWQKGTMEVMTLIQSLRAQGMAAYFTIDAGPNVKVLCLPKDEQRVREKLLMLSTVQHVYTCHPGSGISFLPTSKNKKIPYDLESDRKDICYLSR